MFAHACSSVTTDSRYPKRRLVNNTGIAVRPWTEWSDFSRNTMTLCSLMQGCMVSRRGLISIELYTLTVIRIEYETTKRCNERDPNLVATVLEVIDFYVFTVYNRLSPDYHHVAICAVATTARHLLCLSESTLSFTRVQTTPADWNGLSAAEYDRGGCAA